MVVEEMRERMSSKEFLYWTRYHARKAQAEELASRGAQ